MKKTAETEVKTSKAPTNIYLPFKMPGSFRWRYFTTFVQVAIFLAQLKLAHAMCWNGVLILIQNVEHYDFWRVFVLYFFCSSFSSLSFCVWVSERKSEFVPFAFDFIICAAPRTSHWILDGNERRHGDSLRGKSMRHTQKLWQNTECEKVIYAVSD